MKRRNNLLALHLIGSTYGIRPSQMVGVYDEWAAYQLDLACLTAWSKEQKAQPEAAPGTPPPNPNQKFRDPTPYVTRRMKVPESGVW